MNLEILSPYLPVIFAKGLMITPLGRGIVTWARLFHGCLDAKIF